MSALAFYRIVVWLPLVPPALVALATHGFGLRPSGVVRIPAQLMLAALLMGGVPYGVLALGAMFWMEQRSEREIQRAAILAPLLTSAAWLAFWALVFFGNVATSQRQTFSAAWFADGAMFFLATAAAGVAAVLALGYGYVGLTFWIREHARRAGWIR